MWSIQTTSPRSGSPAELQQRFTALQGPRLDAFDRAQPMPQLRARVSVLLDQLGGQLEAQRRLLPSADPIRLLPEILRSSLGGLVLAAGFAALARRPGKKASLLEEPLLLWALQDERPPVEPAGNDGARRRSASPEEEYMLQLSGEADEPPQP